MCRLQFYFGQGVLNNLSDPKFDHSKELCHWKVVGWVMAMVGGQRCCGGGSVCYVFLGVALSTRGCKLQLLGAGGWSNPTLRCLEMIEVNMKSSIRSERLAQCTLGRSGHHGGVRRRRQSYVDSRRHQYQTLLLSGEYRTLRTIHPHQWGSLGNQLPSTTTALPLTDKMMDIYVHRVHPSENVSRI